MRRTSGLQAVQSLLAIGSGGLLGLGLGNEPAGIPLPARAAKRLYLRHVVCEELGLVGAALVLLLFALLIIRGVLAGHPRHETASAALVIVGITTLLCASRCSLNVAVVTNLLPNDRHLAALLQLRRHGAA